MNDDQYWGKSPWKADELHDASIECAWVDKSIRWIGIGTLKVKERPNGEQKIEVVCEARNRGASGMKIVNIPRKAFASIKRNQDPDNAKFIIQK